MNQNGINRFLAGALVLVFLFLGMDFRIVAAQVGDDAESLGQCAYPTLIDAPIIQAYNNYNPSMYAGSHLHKGVDLKVGVGAPVYADLGGTVIVELVQKNNYGRHLIIRHPGGSISIFAHLSMFKVEVGAQVTLGQLIGLSGGDPGDNVGGDGASTGAHLHWEIRPAGYIDNWNYAVDPYVYCQSIRSARYQLAYVNAAQGLNVRINPDPQAPVLYVLTSREEVRVVDIRDGWARLDADRPEWVLLTWLDLTGEYFGDMLQRSDYGLDFVNHYFVGE